MQTVACVRIGVGDVLAAYAQLAEADPAPLARLLDPDVEWVEYDAARQVGRIVGAGEVARLLAECCDAGARPALIGAAKHGNELRLEFATPWWRRRSIFASLRDDAASAVQSLSLDGRITRIESFTGI